MKEISVIIPTLQKNKTILNNLITSLVQDSCVDEIIVIDNSCNGYKHSSKKVRVIVPKENLFVNPSWNLGVKEAKNEIIALLNDDIAIPKDFCKNIVKKITPDMGCVGVSTNYVQEINAELRIPENTSIYLEEIKGRYLHWGIVIFFYKSSYFNIPNDIKIFYGDDWLIFQNKKQNKKNYQICGQKIYHWGSLSSNNKKFNLFKHNDKKLYKKHITLWWQYIFNFEFIFYGSVLQGFKLIIFGIEITYHYGKKH